MKEILNKVKSNCKTKRQMKAFNEMVSSLKGERKTFAKVPTKLLNEAVKQGAFL